MQYKIGGEATPGEVMAAWKAMRGRISPGTYVIPHIVSILTRVNPMRFEYEINKCRGLAFEATVEEVDIGGGSLDQINPPEKENPR